MTVDPATVDPELHQVPRGGHEPAPRIAGSDGEHNHVQAVGIDGGGEGLDGEHIALLEEVPPPGGTLEDEARDIERRRLRERAHASA